MALRYLGHVIMIAGIVMAATSCCKKKVYCTGEKLKVAFVGFDRGSIRNIYLKRYVESDTLRSRALDSSQMVYSGTGIVTVGKKDTLWLDDYNAINGPLSGVYPGNSWIISMPAINSNYYVSSIIDDGHYSEIVSCSDKSTQCAKKIEHYAINYGYKDGNTLYISR